MIGRFQCRLTQTIIRVQKFEIVRELEAEKHTFTTYLIKTLIIHEENTKEITTV